MTQRIKTLALILLTLSLSYCADGPNGRRLGAYNLNQNQPGHSQIGNAMTSPRSNFWMPDGLVKAILGDGQQPIQPEIADDGEIKFSNIDWNALCASYPNVDTDKDGIKDDCETALKAQGSYDYAALNPNVFNGWAFGGRYVNPSDPSWEITADEQASIKAEIEKNKTIDLAGLSPEVQKVIFFLENAKKQSQSDMPAIRDAFYNPSNAVIRVSDRFAAYKRSPLFYNNAGDDVNMGLGSGDGIESFPYHVERVGDSVAYLTGYGKDVDSYREHNNGSVKFFAWKTNVIFPENVDEIEVTVAHMTKNSVLQPRSSIYYAINNGDSILSQNQWIKDQGGDYKGSVFGYMTKNIGCDSGDVTVFGVAGGNNSKRDNIILPEMIAFRGYDKAKKQWTTLSRGSFSMQPIGGAQCHETFNNLAPGAIDNTSFFKTTLPVFKMVPKAVDMNRVMGNTEFDLSKVLDRNTTSFDAVKGLITADSISQMDATQLKALQNALAQVDATKLSPADQEWLAARIKDIEARKTALSGKPALTADEQLSTLEKLINDPDFANKTGDIDTLIAALDALDKEGKLTPEQKAKLEALKKANADKKNAGAAKSNEKVIKVSDQGDVTLTADDMRKLQELGFTLQNEDGTPYTPVDGETKKISKEQLDEILKELGNQLDTGKYAPGKGPKDIAEVLNALEKSNPDSKQAIDDFRSKYQEKLPNFDAIQKKLTDPSTLSTYPIDQRIKDLDEMYKNGLLTTDQYVALRMNIEKLRDLANQDFNFKATTIEYNKALKNVIQLEGATIQFASGSNEIRNDSQQLLKRIAKEVQNYKNIKQQLQTLAGKNAEDVKVHVLLRAYTDPSGKSKSKATRDKNNTQLSQCRSDAVKDFFSGINSIAKCDGTGKKISKTFSVLAGAKLDTAQIIDATNIISQGMGPDYVTKGPKPKKADYEALRRVEIYLSETPF